jgi:hypothetical protein
MLLKLAGVYVLLLWAAEEVAAYAGRHWLPRDPG